MTNQIVALRFFSAIASAAMTLAFSPSQPLASANSAQTSALPASIGESQSFLITSKFQGPTPMGGNPPDRTAQLTVTRTTAKDVHLTLHGDSVDDNRNVALDGAGALDRSIVSSPPLAAYENALVLASGGGYRVGDRWGAKLALAGPFGPPPPPGPIGSPGLFGRGHHEAPQPPSTAPQSIDLTVRVVSIVGSTIKLSGSGSTTTSIHGPDGDVHALIAMTVDETTIAGRLASYTESVTNTLDGPPGSMQVASTTTIQAK